MSIVLVGSSSGSITLQEPAVAGTTTLNLPATSGTVVVTGTTPTLNGITFPATQVPSADANTLDDYEEGTWTPTIGGTATYNNRIGNYTKIGNVVTAFCLVNIALIGTGSTTAITGLPFSSARRSEGSIAFFADLSKNIMFISPYAESIAISFIGSTAVTPQATDGIAIFQNNAYVILNVTYSVS
jgi:hypothetical protein